MKYLVTTVHDFRTTESDLRRVEASLGRLGVVTREKHLSFPGTTIFTVAGKFDDQSHAVSRIASIVNGVIGLPVGVEVNTAEITLGERVRHALRDHVGIFSMYEEKDGISIYLPLDNRENRIFHEDLVQRLAQVGLDAEIRTEKDTSLLFVQVHPYYGSDEDLLRGRLSSIVVELDVKFSMRPYDDGVIVDFADEYAGRGEEIERIAALLRGDGFATGVQEPGDFYLYEPVVPVASRILVKLPRTVDSLSAVTVPEEKPEVAPEATGAEPVEQDVPSDSGAEAPKRAPDQTLLRELLRNVGTVHGTTPHARGVVVRLRMEHSRNQDEPSRVAELLRGHGFVCEVEQSKSLYELTPPHTNYVVLVHFGDQAVEATPEPVVKVAQSRGFADEDRAEIERILKNFDSIDRVRVTVSGNLSISFRKEREQFSEPSWVVRALAAAGFVSSVRTNIDDPDPIVLVEYATTALTRDTGAPFLARVENFLSNIQGISAVMAAKDGGALIEFTNDPSAESRAARVTSFLRRSGLNVEMRGSREGARSSYVVTAWPKDPVGAAGEGDPAADEVVFHGVRLDYDPAVGVTATVSRGMTFYVRTGEAAS